MTTTTLIGLIAALPLAYLAFVLVRLGVPQRLALLLRMPADLSTALEDADRRYGERPLIELQYPLEWSGASGTSWSARRILATCGRLSAVWKQLELKTPERLAIYKANQFDLFLFSASAIRTGAIAAPINCNVAPAVAARYLEYIGARILVTDRVGYANLYDDPAITPPSTVGTVVITDAGAFAEMRNPVQVLSLPTLLAQNLPAPAPVMRGPDDALYIAHTSGTTGIPKGVILESRGIIQSLRSALLFNFVSRRDVAYLALPLNHQVAQLYLYAVVMMGIRTILNLDFDPRRILGTIEQQRPSLFFGFPITYTRMMESGSDARSLDSVRVWGTTADASHEVQQRAFVGKGCFFSHLGLPLRGALFVDGLGSSEVGIAALLRIVTPWTKTFGRRVGRRTPFGPKLRVVDADGVDVPRGQPGRFMIKGPCMFGGYWNAHDTLYGASRDGWWFTGDIVRQEQDGEFSHLDREVDVMRTRRGPVYTLPIEERVLMAPGVLDTTVFAVRDEHGYDQPAAVVALRKGSKERAVHVLQAELNALLHEAERLQYVWVIPWEDFPIGATGKTLKRMLRETYGEIARAAQPDTQQAAEACEQPA